MSAFPRWYTPVVVLAVLWNALGCFAIYTDLTLTSDQVAAMTPPMQAAYQHRADWSVIASVVAVLGGLLGSLLLLQKNPRAPVLLWASLLGLLVQDVSFALDPYARPLLDGTAIAIQSLVLLIAVVLLRLGYQVVRWRMAAFDKA